MLDIMPDTEFDIRRDTMYKKAEYPVNLYFKVTLIVVLQTLDFTWYVPIYPATESAGYSIQNPTDKIMYPVFGHNLGTYIRTS